jgi:hypothetical protein
MSTPKDYHDAGLSPVTKIAEAASKQLALEKAYALIDRYVAELEPDVRANPFTREPKDLKQVNDK